MPAMGDKTKQKMLTVLTKAIGKLPGTLARPRHPSDALADGLQEATLTLLR